MNNSVKDFGVSTLFMAVAAGNKSTDAAEIKRYIGVGACKVIGVNPTGAQIKKLMGYEPKEEPVYTGTQEVEGKQIAYARICLVLQTIPEKCNGIEMTQMLNFFIRNQYRNGATSGKWQVIDEFGRTAWATKETIDNKAQIMYSNGPANVTTNYRPCYVGEEELTEFIKTFINIPNPANYVNGTWVMKTGEELKSSLCRLDEIPNYFKGNVKEIKDTIALQPENYVKVLFGIRTTDDGKEYQDVYNKVLRSSATNYEKLQAEIEDRKNNGALANRTYEFCELKEYKLESTNYSESSSNDDPFAGGNSDNTPWG